MSKKLIITLAVIGGCILLCAFGLLLNLLFASRSSQVDIVSPDSTSQDISSTDTPQPTGFGKRSLMVTVFTVKQDFTNWESFGDYEQGSLRNGRAIAIFHNDPVTKASLVINRGISNGGQLIGQLIAVTDTDPPAMSWITQHLNGGGETTVGHTHILVDDDTEANRVIIEFTFIP